MSNNEAKHSHILWDHRTNSVDYILPDHGIPEWCTLYFNILNKVFRKAKGALPTNSVNYEAYWRNVPTSEIPKEFLAQLVLLGVPFNSLNQGED